MDGVNRKVNSFFLHTSRTNGQQSHGRLSHQFDTRLRYVVEHRCKAKASVVGNKTTSGFGSTRGSSARMIKAPQAYGLVVNVARGSVRLYALMRDHCVGCALHFYATSLTAQLHATSD